MKDKHEFTFKASVIAKAASQEATYHKTRIDYWKGEYAKSIKVVKKTASIKFREYSVTGGYRFEAYVSYGDQGAYNRINEAINKIEDHRQWADRYDTDARVYSTQGERDYELGTEDVRYFRLGGEKRQA